jgi:hypothetical protein
MIPTGATMNHDYHNSETFQEGVTPVQAFVLTAVPPGPDLAPRLGRPVRTPAERTQTGTAIAPTSAEDNTSLSKDTTKRTPTSDSAGA